MIWGYHYFRKHPFCVYIVDSFVVRTQRTTSPSVNMLRGEMHRHGKPWFVSRNDGPKKKTKRKENDWIEKETFLDLGAPNFETHRHIAVFLCFFEYLWLVRIGLLARDSTVPSKKLTTAAWQDLVLVFDEQGKYLKDFASSIVAWVAYSFHKLVSNRGIDTVAQSQPDEIPFVLIKSMQCH